MKKNKQYSFGPTLSFVTTMTTTRLYAKTTCGIPTVQKAFGKIHTFVPL